MKTLGFQVRHSTKRNSEPEEALAKTAYSFLMNRELWRFSIVIAREMKFGFVRVVGPMKKICIHIRRFGNVNVTGMTRISS